MVPIVEAGDAAETVQINVGIARLQWVEGPGHQFDSEPQRIVPLSLLQGDPDASSSERFKDPQLMGAQAQLAIAPAKKGQAEADQLPGREEGAMHEAAIVLHRQQQLAWHDVALGRAPD